MIAFVSINKIICLIDSLLDSESGLTLKTQKRMNLQFIFADILQQTYELIGIDNYYVKLLNSCLY